MSLRLMMIAAAVSASGLMLAGCDSHAAPHPDALAEGRNPAPMALALPASAPLSAVAQLGRQLFFDAALSGSGRQSCASCHDPRRAYGPPADSGAVMDGGKGLAQTGRRAVPSLRYLYRQPAFSIGPENAESESAALQPVAASASSSNAPKSARHPQAAATHRVPQGGLFWDGRVNTLQQQASGPLFNPLEMDAGSVDRVAAQLRSARYASQFTQIFGAAVLGNPAQLLAEALFAIGRFQIEDPSFHPFTSKYDAWLQGRARLTPAEVRGYQAFNDPARGNCAACHPDRPTADHLPPLFTDGQYEALGVPRNPAIPANRDAAYADLGLCGPYRTDLRTQTQYCGMFRTPSLRNVATRHAFFHNGAFQTLAQVLDFYNQRDLAPQKIYPPDRRGKVLKFNDLPAAYRANVDTVDAPLDRHPGQAPAMSAQDIQDLIAFLQTLSDGDAAR